MDDTPSKAEEAGTAARCSPHDEASLLERKFEIIAVTHPSKQAVLTHGGLQLRLTEDRPVCPMHSSKNLAMI